MRCKNWALLRYKSNVDSSSNSKSIINKPSLSDMPLYLKESKQQNKKGSKILDPIETNTYLKSKFKENSWIFINH